MYILVRIDPILLLILNLKSILKFPFINVSIAELERKNFAVKNCKNCKSNHQEVNFIQMQSFALCFLKHMAGNHCVKFVHNFE